MSDEITDPLSDLRSRIDTIEKSIHDPKQPKGLDKSQKWTIILSSLALFVSGLGFIISGLGYLNDEESIQINRTKVLI